MNSRVGKRVKILGGMPEFVGRTGTIIGTEKLGRNEPIYYRVRMDTPVDIPGVGLVRDDLWQGNLLKTVLPRVERVLRKKRAAAEQG